MLVKAVFSGLQSFNYITDLLVSGIERIISLTDFANGGCSAVHTRYVYRLSKLEFQI